MRIISGQFRGKKLVSAPETITRPTLDRGKEGLFNILDNLVMKSDMNWSDIIFADVFAGSGAIGIEALSRGAQKVFFFENHPEACRFLKQNLSGLKGVTYQLEREALKPPKLDCSVDILFADPPYHKGLTARALTVFYQAGWIDKETIIVCETDKNETVELPEFLTVFRTVSYGRNRFELIKLISEEKQNEETSA